MPKVDANDVAAEQGLVALREQTERLADEVENNTFLGGVDLREYSAEKLLSDPTIFTPTEFLSTGFSELNFLLGGGLALGEATNVSAGPGCGKSTFLINVALHLAAMNRAVGFLSLEMSTKACTHLFLSVHGGVRRQGFRTMQITADEEARIADSIPKVAAMPLWIVDRGAYREGIEPNTAAIQNLIRDGIKRYRWEFFGLDYLSLVTGSEKEEEWVKEARVAQWCHQTSQSLGIHFLCLTQSNKVAFKSPGGKTGLENIRGRIEGSAAFDNVLQLSRNDYNNGTASASGLSSLTIAANKVRFGPGGSAEFIFDRATGIIRPAETQSRKTEECNEAFFTKFLDLTWKARRLIVQDLRSTGGTKADAENVIEQILSKFNLREELTSVHNTKDCGSFLARRDGATFSFMAKSVAKADFDAALQPQDSEESADE
jgi:RecA/RadA recombinase